MKRIILLLMAVLAMVSTYAQNGYISNNTPNIVYKPDTMLYLTNKYKVAKNSKTDQLLKTMEGFDIAGDSIWHQGQEVNKYTINGKIYDSLKLASALRKIPADAVENIEMIDDYTKALKTGNHWKMEPDKLLNINIQPLKLPDVNYLLSENNSIIIDGQKHTIIRMDCRDYVSERLGSIIAGISNSNIDPDTDDYGDQVPHFLIQPKPGTYTSKATRY